MAGQYTTHYEALVAAGEQMAAAAAAPLEKAARAVTEHLESVPPGPVGGPEKESSPDG